MARSGFVTLMSWSTAMQDGLVPADDVECWWRPSSTCPPCQRSILPAWVRELLRRERRTLWWRRAAVDRRAGRLCDGVRAVLLGPRPACARWRRTALLRRRLAPRGRSPGRSTTTPRSQFERMLLDALEDESERGAGRGGVHVNPRRACRARVPPRARPTGCCRARRSRARIGWSNGSPRAPGSHRSVSPEGQLDGLRAETLVIHSTGDELDTGRGVPPTGGGAADAGAHHLQRDLRCSSTPKCRAQPGSGPSCASCAAWRRPPGAAALRRLNLRSRERESRCSASRSWMSGA